MLGQGGDERMPAGRAPLPARDRADSPLDRSGGGRVVRGGAHSRCAALGLPRAAAPELPVVRGASWPRNEIDRFVLARLEQAELAPAADADPATLIRRVTLDLTGLPPTPAEVTHLKSPRPRAPRIVRRPTSYQRVSIGCWRRRRYIRRALGGALARRRPLRRQQRLREGRDAIDLEVRRLVGRRAQRRHAVRSLHAGTADRRRLAAGGDRPRSGSRPVSPQYDASTTRAASTRKRRASNGCAIARPRRRRCGWAARSAARAATTTSTIHFRSATSTACWRSSTARARRALALPTAAQAHRQGEMRAARAPLEQALATWTPALGEAQRRWGTRAAGAAGAVSRAGDRLAGVDRRRATGRRARWFGVRRRRDAGRGAGSHGRSDGRRRDNRRRELASTPDRCSARDAARCAVARRRSRRGADGAFVLTACSSKRRRPPTLRRPVATDRVASLAADDRPREEPERYAAENLLAQPPPTRAHPDVVPGLGHEPDLRHGARRCGASWCWWRRSVSASTEAPRHSRAPALRRRPRRER